MVRGEEAKVWVCGVRRRKGIVPWAFESERNLCRIHLRQNYPAQSRRKEAREARPLLHLPSLRRRAEGGGRMMRQDTPRVLVDGGSRVRRPSTKSYPEQLDDACRTALGRDQVARAEKIAENYFHSRKRNADQLSATRRLDAKKDEDIGGEIGGKILAALRRKGIPTRQIR